MCTQTLCLNKTDSTLQVSWGVEAGDCFFSGQGGELRSVCQRTAGYVPLQICTGEEQGAVLLLDYLMQN